MNLTDQYWAKYEWTRPYSEAEERLNPRIDPRQDYKEYLPVDPTHSKAWIPLYVRWAKRYEVGFRCPITGWLESDFYRGISGGPFRRVGPLTIDHILPGSQGGTTTDENTRVISRLANAKKGHKLISDDDLRTLIFTAYKRVEMPEDLYHVLDRYNIIQYKVGYY